jgi:hypothetical protein
MEGCNALYEQVQAAWLADPVRAAVSLLAVDAHALQHPEIHGYKSNAFHLIRLCWILESGGNPSIGVGPRWLQKQFDGTPEIPPLPPPADRGSVTVADVADAADATSYIERVGRWGQSVWDAWAIYHEWARQAVKDMKGDASR